MTQPKYLGPAFFNEATKCPQCKSKDNVTLGYRMSTLVGWRNGEDPNHWTEDGKCSACELHFVRHWVKRGHKVWYTVDHDEQRYVVRGLAGCCETNYSLSCDCGGWRRHSIHILKLSCFSYGYINGDKTKYAPRQPMYWFCEGCLTKFPDLAWGDKYMTEESVKDTKSYQPELISK